jgi:RimJ/RimL family protein N-acetyltransferase
MLLDRPALPRITLEASSDVAMINQVITHPEVWGHVTDDASPAREQFTSAGAPMLFVIVRCDGELAGMFALQFHSSVMAEVHTCLLPIARGRVALVAGRAMLAWIFDNTSCRKLITLAPSFNRPAAWYARAMGLRQEGCITCSYLKGGQMHDQFLFGIHKEDARCQS